MITSENLKFAFEDLTAEQVQLALNGISDYLRFELMHCNAGSVAMLENTPYNEEDENETNDNGNLFVDKDTFLQLYIDSGADNEAINEHL